MFIFNLILILFIVVVTILLIALVIVRRIMWKVKRTVGKVFTSNERYYEDRNDSINVHFKNKRIVKQDDGEYVDFEEIKE